MGETGLPWPWPPPLSGGFRLRRPLVSSRTKTSVTSLVLCLFLWVLLVFIVPNLSSYFAESFVGIQSRDNLDRVLDDFDKIHARTIAAVEKNLPRPDWQMSWYSNSAEDGYRGAVRPFGLVFRMVPAADGGRRAHAPGQRRQEVGAAEGVSRQPGATGAGGRPHGHDLSGRNLPDHRLRFVRNGPATYQARMDDVRRYRETFVRYLQGKNIFASSAYITPTPPSAFRTADQLVEARSGGRFKNVKEYDDWAGKQADFRARFQILNTVKLPNDSPAGFPYLMVDDMPRFAGRPVTVLGALEDSILRLGLILFESLALFALAYVGFIRYDVR